MGPRDRIASHLRRILVAAGVALPLPGHSDTSTPTPPGKGGDKKPENPPGGKTKEPEHLGYEVVDMMPEPYVQPTGTGYLDLRTTPPGLTITIDGKRVGRKSPLSHHKLAIGLHAITISDGRTSSNFTVSITANKTTVERQPLVQPSPAPKAEKKP